MRQSYCEGENTVTLTLLNLDPENWSMDKEDVFHGSVPLRTLLTTLPKEYDKLLTRGYGDYMFSRVEGPQNHHPGAWICKWKDVMLPREMSGI